MRENLPVAAFCAALCAVALVGVLAPAAAAAPAAPLPLPVAAVEPLVTEGVSIEGPLVQNVSLPTLT
ncbi:hypothetical protein ADK65_24560 [Streptomyces sp. NRRL B-1140]|uniref:hypothetical protein n=1 Tax=Streptomyces sp. NRRL B-1140 TaxID=1415549 RepID=UPI0006AF2A5A|nr:hypothetical protein [Streptomyces sp. NRRL B-1140]KOV97799.1 hypothetical protein ADK65_24560 [Streptomyces sp. NRRL B-1140]